MTLPEPTNLTQELLDAGVELLNKRLPPRHPPVRLLDSAFKSSTDRADHNSSFSINRHENVIGNSIA